MSVDNAKVIFKQWRFKGGPAYPFIILLDDFTEAAVCFNLCLKLNTNFSFWTAVACVPENISSSMYARHLLKQLAQKKFSEIWALNEWQGQKTKYLWLSNKESAQQLNISVSHSGQQVAVIIAPPLVGIDIECYAISPSVAYRYFHPVELDYLATLPDVQAAKCRRLLWQMKESYIKAHQLTLFSGLKVNMLPAYLSKISL